MINKNECDLCKSTQFTNLYKIERFKTPFNIVKCDNCKLIFMNPYFDEKEIISFYDEDYYKGKSSYSYIDERDNFEGCGFVWRARIKRILKELGIKSAIKEHFLDIGCSFGGLIKTAEGFGFSPCGLDLSSYAIDYCKNNLKLENVINSTLNKGLYPENFFKVVTMVEVIEHLNNPYETLLEIYRIMKDGGILLIQTANMDGMQAKWQKGKYHYFLPGHLHYFSRDTLSLYAKKIGFKKIKFFYPVDFGLLPKLIKSGRSFKSLKEYLKWFRISFYHIKSKIHFGGFALTSSLVAYLRK